MKSKITPTSPGFHSDSMNIDPITNLAAGGEWAADNAQSTYTLCTDTIRSQLFNWSNKCWLLMRLFCVQTHCNSLVPGQPWTRNRTRHQDLLLPLNTVTTPLWQWASMGASMIFSFASWMIYVPTGCRHPFIRYWLPSMEKTTATYSLPHPENERQRSITDFELRILRNSCSNLLQTSIHYILAAFTGKDNCGMLAAASWKWASTEGQHV